MSDCLFCGIVEGKVKANIVYQNDLVLAFNDIGPKAPVHVLLIPRKHIVGVLDITTEDGARDCRDFSGRRAVGAPVGDCRKRLPSGR